MFNPLRRFRWYALALAVALAVFFAWSRPHAVYFAKLTPPTNSGWVVGFSGGQLGIIFVRAGPAFPTLANGFTTEYTAAAQLLRQPDWQQSRGVGPIVPIWILAALFLLIAILGWIPPRRRPTDCPQCGYDLRGALPASHASTDHFSEPVTCPECGKAGILPTLRPLSTAS